MKIEYSKRAIKAINSMDRPTKQRMRTSIEKLPDGDVKPLKGSDGSYRLRVGNWRVIYSLSDAGTILIERIAPRGEVKYIRGCSTTCLQSENSLMS